MMVADFDTGAAGLQHVTDDNWIPELGIRYKLGVDGLNLWLILLTDVLVLRVRGLAALRPVGAARGCSRSTWAWARRPCWARSSRRTWRCSSSSST